MRQGWRVQTLKRVGPGFAVYQPVVPSHDSGVIRKGQAGKIGKGQQAGQPKIGIGTDRRAAACRGGSVRLAQSRRCRESRATPDPPWRQGSGQEYCAVWSHVQSGCRCNSAQSSSSPSGSCRAGRRPDARSLTPPVATSGRRWRQPPTTARRFRPVWAGFGRGSASGNGPPARGPRGWQTRIRPALAGGGPSQRPAWGYNCD